MINIIMKKNLIVEKLLKIIIREARIKGHLVCGLKETIKMILKKKGIICLLAKNCEIKPYRVALKALCKAKKVKLFIVISRRKLGRYCKLINRNHKWKNKFKIIPCSSCLIMKSNTYDYLNTNLNKVLQTLFKLSFSLGAKNQTNA